MPSSTGRPNSYPQTSHSGVARNSREITTYQDSRICCNQKDACEAQRQAPEAEMRAEFQEKRVFSGTSNKSDLSTASTLNGSAEVPQLRLRSIAWKVLLVLLAVPLLSTIVLAIILALKVKTKPSLFSIGAFDAGDEAGFILVNYSATRLTFVSSLLSMVAPLLSGVIMDIWSLCTARNLHHATQLAEMQDQSSNLPTVVEFKSLVGLLQASAESLLGWVVHFSKKRSWNPKVVHKAAAMLIISLLLTGGLFLANTVLQYTTQAVNFDAITVHPSPLLTYGRGISEVCLDLNRSVNEGFPCTYPLNATKSEAPTLSTLWNEIFYLQHNTSSKSEIRLVARQMLVHGDLAILIPKPETVPANLDFRASTVGVSTQCQPMTQKCHMQSTIPGGPDTQFNCTDNFWGVLGKLPNVTAIGEPKSVDPDLPPMAFKPSQSLQIEFFGDPDLSDVYDTGKYNISTGDYEESITPLPDADLINPVYVAFAGRFNQDEGLAGSNLSSDVGFFQGDWAYWDFALNCSYATYDVDYSWANGTIQDLAFTLTPNGSFAEMYHGVQSYWAVGAPALLDNLLQAALTNSSDTFSHAWSNLYSVTVLSQIGAYLSPRLNLLEQERVSMLVTQVPKLPLGVLIGFGLSYVVLGLVLGTMAYRASTAEVRALADDLTLSAVVAAAFNQKKADASAAASACLAAAAAEKPDPEIEKKGLGVQITEIHKKAEASRLVRTTHHQATEKGWKYALVDEEKLV